jgi:hypothetical protein
VHELERVLAHEHAKVALGLGQQAVRVDQPEAAVGGLQRVPLVDVAVHEDRALVVVGRDATVQAAQRVGDRAL